MYICQIPCIGVEINKHIVMKIFIENTCLHLNYDYDCDLTLVLLETLENKK